MSPEVSNITPQEVAAALDGAEAAQRRLVHVLTPVIQSQVGNAVLGSGERRNLRSTTEDLTQEIFLALFRDDGRVLRSWDPSRSPLEGFVAVVAQRRAISLLRIRHHNPRLEEPTPLDEIERCAPDADPQRRAVSRDDLRRLVERLRQKLSPTGCRIFKQLYVLERPIEDVQAEMEMSANAIYQWRNRLKSMARQWLEEHQLDQPTGHDDG